MPRRDHNCATAGMAGAAFLIIASSASGAGWDAISSESVTVESFGPSSLISGASGAWVLYAPACGLLTPARLLRKDAANSLRLQLRAAIHRDDRASIDGSQWHDRQARSAGGCASLHASIGRWCSSSVRHILWSAFRSRLVMRDQFAIGQGSTVCSWPVLGRAHNAGVTTIATPDRSLNDIVGAD